MYYDSGKETGISFTGVSTSNLSAVNNNNYLWGFVYSGGGIKLYNKSAGDSKALDYANPSTLSAAGTSVSLQLQTGTLGKYGATADGTFAIYDESATKYLNFQSGDLKRWDNSDTGSTFMIDAVNAPTSLSYIVKDVNGASYSGSYSGIAGVTNPAFSGCYGYSLSDQSWHGTTYKANITFPFPVSSNSVTNYTYIGTYSSAFYWYVKSSSATDINVQDGAVPTNQSGENEKFQWAIIPSFSAGAFTFTIKNASTGTYLTSTATDPGTAVNNSHPQGKVTLSTEGTPLTYTSYPSWYIPSTERYVSINTISKQTEQYVGIYTGNHYGTQMTFHTPANFTTLITGLTAAKTATAGITIGSDYGEYTTTDAYATALTNATSVINGESYATAADISEWGNTILTNPTLNLPVAPCFLRVKTRHNTYLSNTASTYSGYTSYLAHIAEANNSTLFYFDGTYLIDYAEGLKMNGCNVGSVGGAGKSFTFAESTHEPYAGKYSLKITEDNKYVYSWGNPYNFSWGEASEAPNTVMTLEKVTSLPITMHEVGGASYGTINMPVAVTLPSGLYAYSATAAENGVLTLTKVVEGGVLAANTPVVLYSAAPVTELAISDATGAEATGNKFDGTVAAITAPTTGTNYVLSNGDAGVGFYKYTGASVPGFKAYYNEPTSNVKGFVFSFDDVETAIRAIETENNGLEIHDIAGRRVQKAEKGLYIINGKKVMFK